MKSNSRRLCTTGNANPPLPSFPTKCSKWELEINHHSEVPEKSHGKNFSIKFRLETSTGHRIFQEGNEVRIYGSIDNLTSNLYLVDSYILVQFAGKSETWYVLTNGEFLPWETWSIPPPEPTNYFKLAGNSRGRRALLSAGWVIPESTEADNLLVAALLTERGSFGYQLAPIEYLELTITPGPSSFSGILTHPYILTEDPTECDPDGGSPTQGFGKTRLPADHWSVRPGPLNPWNLEDIYEGEVQERGQSTTEGQLSGIEEYGFFGSDSAEGKPVVVVKLRSAFKDDSSEYNVGFRCDAWFHFLVKVPPKIQLGGLSVLGSRTFAFPVEISLTQRGRKNRWIDYGSYDWSYFAPLVRLVAIDEVGIVRKTDWIRWRGIAIDRFTFRFELSTENFEDWHPNSMRYFEVAQGPPFPPSLSRKLLRLYHEKLDNLGYYAEIIDLGEGGLSTEKNYPESNRIRGLWIASTEGVTSIPITLILAPHLEPVADFVIAGMIEEIIDNPNYHLANNQYLIFFDNDPDGRKWGLCQAYPSSGLNPSSWFLQQSKEGKTLNDFLYSLVHDLSFNIVSFLEFHCEAAPTPVNGIYQVMPVYGYFSVQNDDEGWINNIRNLLRQFRDEVRFNYPKRLGTCIRKGEMNWNNRPANSQIALHDPNTLNIRNYIVMEFPQIALYLDKETTPHPNEQVIGDYILGPEHDWDRFAALGSELMKAMTDNL